MSQWLGRVVVITGAGSGIGRSLAELCAAEGAHLALGDINEKSLRETATALEERGTRVIYRAFDVSRAEDCHAFAAQVEASFGRADVLFNNAGVSLSNLALETQRRDFEWLFNINFWGVVNGCEAFHKLLQRSPRAQIINISSLFGLIGVASQAAYCASKFAVRGYSESLRAELAPLGIRVSGVYPGGVASNIVSNGRHYKDVLGEKTDTTQQQGSFARLARLSPDAAARIILRGAMRGRTRILVGRDALFFDRLQRYLPRLAPLLIDRAVRYLRRRIRSKAAPQSGLKPGAAPSPEQEKAAG